MTKKEIVRQISEQTGLTQLATKEIVRLTFEAILKTLLEEKRIELRNFGVFEVKRRKARKARNPKKQVEVFVPAKNVVTFKPGKEMMEQVRELSDVEETKAKSKKKKQRAAVVATSSNNSTPKPKTRKPKAKTKTA